jgi:hypothetical protein
VLMSQKQEVAEDSLVDSFVYYMLVEFLGQEVPAKDSVKVDIKDIEDIVKDKLMEAAIGGLTDVGLAGLSNW